MAKDKYQVSLKAFLRNDKGEVLFLKGLSTGAYAGLYDVPGGRIEDDEFAVPLLDILRREIREELGEVETSIDLRPALVSRDALGGDNGPRIIYLFFEGKFLGGEIKISDEHTGYVWEDPRKLDIEKDIKLVHREIFRKYFLQ
jgi:8-oxo-dGTP diphosphatase